MLKKDHQADQIMENNAQVNFYADMNGNLKLRLHNSLANKYVIWI